MLVNYKTMVLFVKIWNLFEQAPRNFSSRQRIFVESGFICGFLSFFFGFCFVHIVSLCSWLACPWVLSHSLPCGEGVCGFQALLDPLFSRPLSFPQWVYQLLCYKIIHMYTRVYGGFIFHLIFIYNFLITGYFVVLFALLTLFLVTWLLAIWVGLMIDKLSLMSSDT